jgi:hypothetical protein
VVSAKTQRNRISPNAGEFFCSSAESLVNGQKSDEEFFCSCAEFLTQRTKKQTKKGRKMAFLCLFGWLS